jgi:gliding motility-associated-like protein
MKKLIAILFFFLIFWNAQAQQRVFRGSVHQYTIKNENPLYSFIWTTSGGTSSSLQTKEIATIKWDGFTGIYTLSVILVNNISGCASNPISLEVEIIDGLIIPNAFTPNDDGQNDLWIIGGLEGFPDLIVTIFDSWGRTIFRSEKGYPKPWDGEWKGVRVPIDAYYYIIDLNNGDKLLKGSVTLIR